MLISIVITHILKMVCGSVKCVYSFNLTYQKTQIDSIPCKINTKLTSPKKSL